MSRHLSQRSRDWLLEAEIGFVWGIAGISIFVFVFTAIWYIDPAVLTLLRHFRQADCTTVSSAVLIGVSNCSWTSCRLGCTREVFKCWQLQVEFKFVKDAPVYKPPWSDVFSLGGDAVHRKDQANGNQRSQESRARLYPNVRGCGYPPGLNCELFYQRYGPVDAKFTCWVSTLDTSIAMTALDLERAKREVMYSLVPLFIFIVFVLYAFCRRGVFSCCNRDLALLNRDQLEQYRRRLSTKNNSALVAFQVERPSSTLIDADVTRY